MWRWTSFTRLLAARAGGQQRQALHQNVGIRAQHIRKAFKIQARAGDGHKQEEQGQQANHQHKEQAAVVVHLAPLEVAVGNVHAQGTKLFYQPPNQLAIDKHHGNQCAQVEHDVKENAGHLNAKDMFGDGQVAAAGDWQKLRQALDDALDDGVENTHKLLLQYVPAVGTAVRLSPLSSFWACHFCASGPGLSSSPGSRWRRKGSPKNRLGPPPRRRDRPKRCPRPSPAPGCSGKGW